MRGSTLVFAAAAAVLVVGVIAPAYVMDVPTRPIQPSGNAPGGLNRLAPLVIMQQGDTVWVEPHIDTTYCPGGVEQGGEGTGGPDGSETWCFEGGPFDTCGTNPPWDVRCFTHMDVRTEPSPSGSTHWHVDQYRTDEEYYLGHYSLWCGRDEFAYPWPPGCGDWANMPGYGNSWHCIAELALYPDEFWCEGGCSLMFDVRYDLECKYDYLYVEFYNDAEWITLATFNGTSNNPGDECGDATGGNPDYWGNTDIDRHLNCRWQPRTISGVPAFHIYISSAVRWRDITGPVRPDARFHHSMAYDPVRNKVVLYGGMASDDGPYLGDTWELSGAGWQEIFPAHSPGPRSQSQMVYDAAHGRMLLFGGLDEGFHLYDDTWVWDGTDWTELSPPHSPPERAGHGMAYDPGRERVVLFGGSIYGDFLNDTWEWDGTDWTECTPATSPPVRCFWGGNGLAYAPSRARCVLYAGGDTLGLCHEDTWEWDGVNWSEITEFSAPGPLNGHVLTECPTLPGTVLFGGHDSLWVAKNWTWLYDVGWEQQSPPASPRARRGHAMAYDTYSDRVVLFGGRDEIADVVMADTWEMVPDSVNCTPGRPVKFRWRFASDGAGSDADGLVDTDGGAFIDNVWIISEYDTFYEEFEDGYVDTAHWSFPDPDPVADFWHLELDPNPPYEDGYGPFGLTCASNRLMMWQASYTGPGQWPADGWHQRLLSPVVPIMNTGCVVQYDQYMCAQEFTRDYTDTKVRFRDWGSGLWCPWINIDGCYLYSGCSFWNMDYEEDVSHFYGAFADSMQFAWDILDLSGPTDPSYHSHRWTENVIDNVSIGFYGASATRFSARSIDLLHDTFYYWHCAYNSFFPFADPDSLVAYGNGAELPRAWQLRVDVTDRDYLAAVDLYAVYHPGEAGTIKPMTLDFPADPFDPAIGGVYCGSLCPQDFSLSSWGADCEVWYYILAVDNLGNGEYFPSSADPEDPEHTGIAADYFTFSAPSTVGSNCIGPKVLLVNAYGREVYDLAPCLSAVDNLQPLVDIYEETLTDIGLCCDRYDILGAGCNVQVHPRIVSSYDIVIWFTGPYLSDYLFMSEAREAIEQHLNMGGKVLICGDRVAYDLHNTATQEDPEAEEFLDGVLGVEYLEEMEDAFTKPYVYLEAVESVDITIGGDSIQVPVALDTLLLYRQCPSIKDMSYVLTSASPPQYHKVQPLLRVLNAGVAQADAATYVETHGTGQCVFLNFDISGLVNHTRTYCAGTTPAPAGPFSAGNYDGRVELLHVILMDILGGEWSGIHDGPGKPDAEKLKWALAQNHPNPSVAGTEIRYETASPCHVTIIVYDAAGRYVCELVDEKLEPGKHSVRWDGRNANGAEVADGVYFYRMNAGTFSATRKLVLLK